MSVRLGISAGLIVSIPSLMGTLFGPRQSGQQAKAPVDLNTLTDWAPSSDPS